MVSGGKVLSLYSWTVDILARTPFAWSRCECFFFSNCSSAQRGLDVNVSGDNCICALEFKEMSKVLASQSLCLLAQMNVLQF